MSFPRYSIYRNSGIAWTSELPAHWGLASLKWLCSRFSGGTPEKDKQEYWENGTIPWLNSGAVNDGRIYKASAYITQPAFDCSSAKWIPAGALVMALAGQGKTKGMVAQLMFESTCNQSMAAIVPGQKVISRYLYWWLTSNYQNIRNMAGGDLRDGLNLELLGSIPCPIPALEEQRLIASFLDRETTKIDRLIAEQEKLIGLLVEKCQSATSYFAIQGLDPHSAKKLSGMPWLEELPEHWSVKQLKHVARRGTAITYGIVQAGSHVEGGVPYIKTSDMSGENLPLDGYSRTTPEIDAIYSRSKVATGDIVIAIRASVGKCLPVPAALAGANLTQGTAKVSPSDEISQMFLLANLRSNPSQAYFNSMAKGATFREITIDALRRIPVVVPPINEQLQIVNFLELEATKINQLKQKAERSIDLLRERRGALISAAITGQIDVRAVMAKSAAPEELAA